eukprot:4822085-Alexandrium_andersonii.AAC.1
MACIAVHVLSMGHRRAMCRGELRLATCGRDVATGTGTWTHGHSVSQPANQPTSQSVSQPVNQSISASVSQSISQSVSQSISQSVSQSAWCGGVVVVWWCGGVRCVWCSVRVYVRS